jgi:hypothetical protein
MFQQSASIKRIVTTGAAVALLAIAASGCGGDKTAAGSTGAAEATTATTHATTPPPILAPPPVATATATPSASADDGEADAPAEAGAKKFDCGAKGQKPCPMQKWMKTVMAGASSSGEGAKLAEALTYVARNAPPGFDKWSALAADGAKKARADDIDGAKVSCKQCHDLYKKKYKSTLRDRPF